MVMVRPCGDRIKVRGDKYIADCRLLIADWKKFPLPSGERIKVRGDKYVVDC